MSSQLLAMDWGLAGIAWVFSCLLLWLSAGMQTPEGLVAGMAFPLLMMTAHRRISLWEATLPVDGGTLVRHRLQIKLLGILSIAATALVFMALRWPVVTGEGLLLIAAAAALAAALALLIHQIRPTELSIPDHYQYFLWLPLGMGSFFSPSATSVLLVSGAAFAILLPKTLREAPKAYQLPSNRPWFRISLPSLTPAFAWKPVVRSLVSTQMVWPFLWLFIWRSDLLFLAPLLLTLPLGQCFTVSPWLFSLPVPRRRIFLTVAGLFGVAMTGIFLVESWFTRLVPYGIGYGHYYHQHLKKGTGTENLLLPLAYWQKAPAGIAPVLTAPWGETAQASTGRILWTTLYNPYTVNPSNSQRFFDWQFQRATASVFGRPLTQEQLKEQYPIPLQNQPRAILIALTAIWSGAFACWALFALLPSRLPRWVRWLYICCPLLFVSVYQWQSDFHKHDSFANLILRVVGGYLPDNLLLLGLLCLFTALAAYLWAERAFNRLDARFTEPAVGAEE